MSYQDIIPISVRGQVVIPKKAREAIGLRPNGRLKLVVSPDKKIVLEAINGFAADLEGSAKGLLKGRDAVDYVRSLREDRS